jgi:hypothetical protein
MWFFGNVKSPLRLESRRIIETTAHELAHALELEWERPREKCEYGHLSQRIADHLKTLPDKGVKNELRACAVEILALRALGFHLDPQVIFRWTSRHALDNMTPEDVERQIAPLLRRREIKALARRLVGIVEETAKNEMPEVEELPLTELP